jgi:hypothetical protein
MKTIVWTTTLLLALASATSAQTPRLTPPKTGTQQDIAIVTEPGARGDFQIVALRVTPPYCTPVNPYAPARPRVAKETDDLLFYDRRTGHSLLVTTYPFPGLGYITEVFQYLLLPEGVEWTTTDLDADGSSDIIGYRAKTGEVVRVYRQNPTTQCTPQ